MNIKKYDDFIDFYKYINKELNQKYPIEYLYNSESVINLTKNYICEISKLFNNLENNQNIQLNKIYIDIIIDGGCYINKKNKIILMLILCSLSKTFKCLNINYSLIVIADRHFTLHIKKYDDEESIKYFQIVYDCLFCNRYRLDLFNGLKFIIEKIPNNKMKKIIITLTDGITEQLLFIDDWNKSLFNKENISFGFIFIMPPIKGDDNEKIKILWNNFEKGSSKSISNVKVIQIEDGIKLELINDIFKTFIIQTKDEKDESNDEEIKKMI